QLLCSDGFGFRLSPAPRLLLRLLRNDPLQFALALEQGRVNAATDLGARFMKQLQQRARAASLAREQRRSSKALIRVLHMQAHEDFDIERLEVSHRGKEGRPKRGTRDCESHRFKRSQCRFGSLMSGRVLAAGAL